MTWTVRDDGTGQIHLSESNRCTECCGQLPPYQDDVHLPLCQRPDHWALQGVTPPADYDGGAFYRAGDNP